MKSILKKIRLPRKVMFIVAGVLLLSGASGAYALFMVQGEAEEESASASVSGLACTTIDTLKMRRNGQRWIRKYINVEKGTGEERVRTALRVAGLLVHAEKADLYQVAVLDTAGPKERADWRGPAIGAQVLFAPDPKAVPGMTAAFSARYSDGAANMVGLYYGEEVSLSQDQIKDTLTSIIEKTECTDPPPPEGAEGSEAGGHGEPSSGHGEAAESGHGEAAESGHGEAGDHGAAEAEGHGEEGGHDAEASEGHGEKAAEGHGEEAAAEGHGEAEAGEKSEGILASITGMIFGSSEEKPEAADHAPAEGHDAPASEAHGEPAPAVDHSAVKPEGHGEAAADAEGHGETAAEGHGEEVAAEDHGEAVPGEKSEGMFASVTNMIFGSDEEKPEAADHAPVEGHEAPAAEAHGDDAAAPADASTAHGATEEHNASGGHGDAVAPAHEASESHGPAAEPVVAHEPADAAATAHDAGDEHAVPAAAQGHEATEEIPAEAKDAHAAPEPHADAKSAEHSDAGEHAAEPKADAHDLTAEAETKKEPAAH